MMEDCATRMSVPHGSNDDKDVVETFKEALKQRVGVERYQMWFTHGVDFVVHTEQNLADSDSCGQQPDAIVMVKVRGQFALDRIKNNLLRELRGAAMQACGSAEVALCLDQPVVVQSELPLPGLFEPAASIDGAPKQRSRARQSKSSTASLPGKTQSLASLVAGGAVGRKTSGAVAPNRWGATASTAPSHLAVDRRESPTQLALPNIGEPEASELKSSALRPPTTSLAPLATEKSFDNFVLGPCNQLAHTAMAMVRQDPRVASPLFIFGPTGSGKSHILAAIADQFRRRHRMRRVMLMSAEQFTNDFISSVGNSGIASFRRRYREVDALLIDGMQFLGAKTATLREMLYTVETIVSSGRPMIASGTQSPSEIQGLTNELAGRLSAGLVCPLRPLDIATRETLLRREISQCCRLPMPDSTIQQINATLSGDGRILKGIANLTNTLQRMLGRIPTIDELRHFGGDLLRASHRVATLSVIESAVCQTFQLPTDTLRGGSQTRAVTEPRMLAMYLSRQLTSSAYSEIARHFGGRSHSTAISAEKNVKKWLDSQRSIGRGMTAMSAQEAIDRVESLLRSG